jgi:nitrogen PTS system EIIA component
MYDIDPTMFTPVGRKYGWLKWDRLDLLSMPACPSAALQARENLGSTGLGSGFALPHARLVRLTRPFASFVRLARPIDFAAIDERPVDLVILLLTPEDAGSQHLATLAALARPLREEGFVQRLRQAPDAAALHRLLAGG